MDKLPGAIALLKESFSIYKKRFFIFLGIVIIPMLIMFLFAALMAGGGFFASKLADLNSLAQNTAFLISVAIPLFLVIFITQFWGQTALIYAIKDSEEGIGIKEAYRRGWKKIIPLILVSLLAGIIVVGGFILLIIPGIIFAIWFSMIGFVVIAEDMKGLNAVLKSRWYVKGHWWGVLWRIIFIGLLFFIVMVICNLIPFFNFVAQILLTPLVAIYMFLVYHHLKNIKEGSIFEPTSKEKTIFVAIGILGIAIAIGIPLLTALF